MRGKILIVDDDDTVRGFLATILSRGGYEVVEADSVPEGRSALKQMLPDLLIADVRLGAFNGLQLLAMNPRPIPTIVLTGFPDPVLEVEARQLGARFFLKPIEQEVLLLLVEEVLRDRPTMANDPGPHHLSNGQHL